MRWGCGVLAVSLCALLAGLCADAARPDPEGPSPLTARTHAAPDFSGYIEINATIGSALYYAYYEAVDPPTGVAAARRPILLWLQGGPGAASTFGAFYEIGPWLVEEGEQPRLVRNPHSWATSFGLLLVDQPVGVGYSPSGACDTAGGGCGTCGGVRPDGIPTDQLAVAEQLYLGLLGFFDAHPQLQHRPFFVTAQSYGGKYAPSIAHYALQAQRQHTAADGAGGELRAARALGAHVRRPNFRLMGMAVGDSLTDPVPQTLVFADAAYGLGLVPQEGRERISQLQERVVDLVDAERWEEAADARRELIGFMTQAAGIATSMDVRRDSLYDAGDAVERLLDSPAMRAVMGAREDVVFRKISPRVADALACDVMRSAALLVADLLAVGLPVLLYQGQFDLRDGPISNTAWISRLDWPQRHAFNAAAAEVWRPRGAGGEALGPPAGWRRSVGPLTQVMVRNGGHLLPHDQPAAARAMIEDWVAQVLGDAAAGGGQQGAGSGGGMLA